MLEIKISLEAKDLSEALTKLANAIQLKSNCSTTETEKNLPEQTKKMDPEPRPDKETGTKSESKPVEKPKEKPAKKPVEKPMSLDVISRAGAALVDQGKMPQILELLKGYGVQAITQLKEDQLPGFAAGLKALGAEV